MILLLWERPQEGIWEEGPHFQFEGEEEEQSSRQGEQHMQRLCVWSTGMGAGRKREVEPGPGKTLGV